MSGPQAQTGAVHAIDHVIVAVADLEAAEAAYTTLLGRGATWAGTHPKLGTSNVLFRIDNAYIELIAATGEGAFADLIRPKLAQDGEGLIGCAFQTADAEALSRRLRAASIEAGEPVPGEGRNAKDGTVRSWKNVMLPPAASRGALVFGIEHLSPPETLPLAPDVAEGGTVREIDHVVLNTGDPEGAIKLYGEGFGFRLALDKTFPQWGARLQFFRAAGVSFEVSSRLEDPKPEQDTFGGFSFRTDDIDGLNARLSEAGLDLSEVRDGRKPGTRVCTVRSGTCGVPTLLIQHPRRERAAG